MLRSIYTGSFIALSPLLKSLKSLRNPINEITITAMHACEGSVPPCGRHCAKVKISSNKEHL